MTIQNPYQTPHGALLDKTNDDGVGEIKFFSMSSRIGRIRYLSHSLLLSILSVLVIGLGLALTISSGFVGLILLAVGYILGVWISILVGGQRLHDLNKSAWWLLLYLAPIVNFGLMLYLVFAQGTQGSNNFGKRPPANKTWNWIFALLFPALIIVGLIGGSQLLNSSDLINNLAQPGYELPVE